MAEQDARRGTAAKASPGGRRALLQVALGALGAAAGARLLGGRNASAADGSSLKIGSAWDANNTGATRTMLRTDLDGTAFRVENRSGAGDERTAIYAQVGAVNAADPAEPTAVYAISTAGANSIGVRAYGATGVQGYASGVAPNVGVYGASDHVGVHGSAGDGGTGVMGTVIGTSGYGVRGIGDDAGTIGVSAEAGSGGIGLSVLGSAVIPPGSPAAGVAASPGPAMLVQGSAVFDGPVAFSSAGRAFIGARQQQVRVKAPRIGGPSSPVDVLATLQSNAGDGVAVSRVQKGRGFFDIVLTGPASARAVVAYFLVQRA